MFEFITNLFESITISQILLVVIIIAAVLYYIYRNTGSNTNDILTSLTSLNKKTDILLPDKTQNMLLGSGGSTVMGFFNLQQGDRTTRYGNDYASILFVDNNWWLEVAHGASSTSARLRVQTNHGGTMTMEHVELPPIPKQKWLFIAILREGRRFDVIYDNRIVASKRLTNYPVIITSPLSVGNPSITGKVIHVITNPTRLSPNEIERQRKIYIDTNNDILDDNPIITSFPTLTLAAVCPSGLPCDNITRPPTNGMLEWSTPYA
jgi:hypothetical protein